MATKTVPARPATPVAAAIAAGKPAAPAAPAAAPTPAAARPGPPPRPGKPAAAAAPAAAPATPAAPAAPGVGREILAQLAALAADVASLKKDIAALQKRASKPADEPLSSETLLARSPIDTLPDDDWRRAYQGVTVKAYLGKPDKSTNQLSPDGTGRTQDLLLLVPSDQDNELDPKGQAIITGPRARASGLLASYGAPNQNGEYTARDCCFLSAEELAALWAD